MGLPSRSGVREPPPWRPGAMPACRPGHRLAVLAAHTARPPAGHVLAPAPCTRGTTSSTAAARCCALAPPCTAAAPTGGPAGGAGGRRRLRGLEAELAAARAVWAPGPRGASGVAEWVRRGGAVGGPTPAADGLARVLASIDALEPHFGAFACLDRPGAGAAAVAADDHRRGESPLKAHRRGRARLEDGALTVCGRLCQMAVDSRCHRCWGCRWR